MQHFYQNEHSILPDHPLQSPVLHLPFPYTLDDGNDGASGGEEQEGEEGGREGKGGEGASERIFASHPRSRTARGERSRAA